MNSSPHPHLSTHTASRLALFAAAVAVLIYVTIGTYVMLFGHFHEDAYILFVYVRNLVETGVISYYAGGPPAEGATDFLWLVALSALSNLGVDVGISVIALNGFGIGLTAYLIARSMFKRGAHAVLVFAVTLIVPLLSGSIAGYGGFSSPLYAGVALLIFVVLFEGRSRALLWMPLLGLILGLFRPDGVIIGVTATFIALALCDRKDRRVFLLWMALCAVIGAGYFVWRWQYFGQTLPLPLIVKSASDTLLPGLTDTLKWLRDTRIPVITSGLFLYFYSENRTRNLLAIAPFALLITALSFAEQSQNISFRFQAPMTTLSFFLMSLFCTRVSQSRNSRKWIWLRLWTHYSA